MNNLTTSVIVLSFEHCDLTIACLESLVLMSTVPGTIIVCDNCSSMQTQQAIMAWGSRQFGVSNTINIQHNNVEKQPEMTAKFVFIQNGANVGFAKGNNSGIKYALACGSSFIWLLNNDTTVHYSALVNLLLCANTDKTDLIGSTVVFDDDKITVQCAGGYSYNPCTTISKPVMGNVSLDYLMKQENKPCIDYIYGASFFVRRQVFEKCGLLNENLFLFNEEVDLCTRAIRIGFKLSWCKNSIVYHKVSQTIGSVKAGNKKQIIFANYHENLSSLLFTKACYPYLLPLTMTFRFFGKLVVALKNRKRYLIKPLWDAYKDFFANRNQRNNYK